MARMMHNEPFGWDVVTAYLERKGGVFVRQTGSHLHYRMPNGQMAGSGTHADVPTTIMRKNAEALGMSYKAMRADMGWPIVSAGRSSFKPKQANAPARTVSKADVLNRIDGISSALGDVRATLTNGLRDPSLYANTYAELTRVEDQIEHLMRAAKGRAA